MENRARSLTLVSNTSQIPFKKFLKEARAMAGLSQRDVADHLGYSTPQFISNWERGVSIPPVNALKKIAVLYHVSAEEVFNVLLEHTLQEVANDLRRKFQGSKKY